MLSFILPAANVLCSSGRNRPMGEAPDGGWPSVRFHITLAGRGRDRGGPRRSEPKVTPADRRNPSRGFVSFVGWSPPSFFFFSRDRQSRRWVCDAETGLLDEPLAAPCQGRLEADIANLVAQASDTKNRHVEA